MTNKVNHYLLVTLLAMMSVAGLMSSDISLPALPQITNDFNATPGVIQQILSFFLLGLSVSQLFYGPVSDRYGRKKVVIAGTVVFTSSSLVCALSQSLEVLIMARLFQAVGACSGMVVGRAIIGDIYKKERAARMFATIFPIIGMSPALSPVIGGYLTAYWGWRSVFVFISGFGGILLTLILVFLQETKDFTIRESIHPSRVIDNYTTVIKHPRFIGYTLVVCSAYASYFAFLAESPFVFNRLGYSSEQMGFFYIAIALSYIIANLVARRVIKSIDIDDALKIGFSLFILGSTGMVLTTGVLRLSPLKIIIPMSILVAGNGFLLPLGVASIITLFPNLPGYASGLMGFLQLGAAAMAAGLIGWISNGQAFNMAITIWIITLLGFISFMGLVVFPKRKIILKEEGYCENS